MEWLKDNSALWLKLVSISEVLAKIYKFITLPMSKYLHRFFIRLPNSKFLFRPQFLNEIFMALQLWEPYVIRNTNLRKGDTVVDVGAHIGYYTLMAAKAVGEEGLVIAIEPDPRNLDILQRNVRLNALRNVRIIDRALSSSIGITTMKLAENPLISVASERINDTASSSIPVRTTTLDDICQKFMVEQIDWLKIDVEESASEVLKGGSLMLKKCREMVIEVPDDETYEIIVQLGFKVAPLLFQKSKYGYFRCVR